MIRCDVCLSHANFVAVRTKSFNDTYTFLKLNGEKKKNSYYQLSFNSVDIEMVVNIKRHEFKRTKTHLSS